MSPSQNYVRGGFVRQVTKSIYSEIFLKSIPTENFKIFFRKLGYNNFICYLCI